MEDFWWYSQEEEGCEGHCQSGTMAGDGVAERDKSHGTKRKTVLVWGTALFQHYAGGRWGGDSAVAAAAAGWGPVMRGVCLSCFRQVHHLPTGETRVLRFPLDEVGLTQSNNESCQWRMWQEWARVSNSLSPYVQIDNYQASLPVVCLAILLVRKPGHMFKISRIQIPEIMILINSGYLNFIFRP